MEDLWGRRLASVLRHRKLSQRKLANNMGVSAQAVGKWVNDSGDIEFARLRALADILDVNWVWLRYGEEALEAAWSGVGERDRVAILRYEMLRTAIQNDQKSRAVLGLLNIGVWEIDFSNGENFWSTATRLMLGVALDARISQSCFRELILPADVPAVDESVRRAKANGGLLTQIFRLKRDPRLEFYAVGRAVRDEYGEVERIVGIIIEGSLIDRIANHQLIPANK